ncbi:sensor histidine kinase [Magnetovibrio sp.]|uniref:sensor histidine kinase n=1 Tax=Magnetovibrio sp. TaxID=2024836 RepID=UPI002F929FB8
MAKVAIVKPALFALAVMILAVMAVWQGSIWSDRVVVDDLGAVAKERLNLYQSTLHAALAKYRYLPFLVARDDSVKALLSNPMHSDDTSANASRALVAINAKSGTDALFVMDTEGTTVAASNWQEPLSFVGRNYSFRPYFHDAMQGGEGGFFAIGATTGEPGYFMSHPVRNKHGIVGVAVVKIDLSPLQHDWRDGGETVFVSDHNGVIFLSSQERWNFRTLAPLSDGTRTLIHEQQQYRGQSLDVLNIKYGAIADADSVAIDGRRYLHASRALNDLGWRLHYLSPVQRVEERRQATLLLGGAVLILLATLLLYWREREQKIISRRRAREAEKFSAINQQLELEIEERRSAEAVLRETQAELVQAGKLAALGKMSAAIAHEINQPIAAIRTFSASARLMLEKGMSANLDKTLGEISALTERMGVITGQLKTFARKAPVRLDPLDVRDAIVNVEKIMQLQAIEDESELVVEMPDSPVIVKADIVRLEQIFINLLRNALDAVRGRAERKVALTLERSETHAKITVEDTGEGVGSDVQERLFDPFFTTKEVGDGVGLGLSITYGIVTDLEGDIRVANAPSGGAVFVVKLPLYEKDND